MGANMLECNRNGRPIPSQDNISIVMKLNNCTFLQTGEYRVDMFVNGNCIEGHEDAARFVWERCLAMDFVNAGLLLAVRTSVWRQVKEIRDLIQKETAQANQQSGN